MIKTWLITGDTHGRVVDRLEKIPSLFPDMVAEETAIIILGDSGINFYLNKTDNKNKNNIVNLHYRVYCVRGNHEARPEELPDILTMYDEDVCGEVYYQEAWPQIRYFKDGGEYTINEKSVLVIGGAYSVDKYYRLSRGIGWFANEQLTEDERSAILATANNKHYDIVMTHTCPLAYEPRDLFLPFVDQSTVEKDMEIWLDEVKNRVDWSLWLFGHYHCDRIEAPYVEQFYQDISLLNEVIKRWDRYRDTGEFDWWLNKSPNFYMEIK